MREQLLSLPPSTPDEGTRSTVFSGIPRELGLSVKRSTRASNRSRLN